MQGFPVVRLGTQKDTSALGKPAGPLTNTVFPFPRTFKLKEGDCTWPWPSDLVRLMIEIVLDILDCNSEMHELEKFHLF